MARRCHDGVSLGSENRQVLSNGDEWALLGFNSSRPLCRSRLSYIAARCFSREGATSRESVPEKLVLSSYRAQRIRVCVVSPERPRAVLGFESLVLRGIFQIKLGSAGLLGSSVSR